MSLSDKITDQINLEMKETLKNSPIPICKRHYHNFPRKVNVSMSVTTGGSRAAITPKMERFVILVNS